MPLFALVLQPMAVLQLLPPAATATVAVSSIEPSLSQFQRAWFGNDGPPSQMSVLFGMISWCNQTAGFTPQVHRAVCALCCHSARKVWHCIRLITM